MVSERKQKLERKRRERELTLFFDREKRMSLRSDFQPLFLNLALSLNLKTPGVNPRGGAAGNHPAALSLQPDFSAVGK